MPRPSRSHTFMSMAEILSKQGTCSRRQVGCIITNKRHHIIGSGYNGNASGLRHCLLTPCLGSSMQAGEGLELCEAIHAEQNALLQCSDVHDIENIYVTTPPCLHCTKLLLNTSCNTIFSKGTYPQEEAAMKLWTSGATPQQPRHWIKYED